MNEPATVLRIVWAQVGDKPSETAFAPVGTKDQRRLGVTLIEVVPWRQVPKIWRKVLKANAEITGRGPEYKQ